MEANGKTGDDRDRVPSYQRNVNKQTDDSRENDRIQSFPERRRKKKRWYTHPLAKTDTYVHGLRAECKPMQTRKLNQEVQC